MPEYEKSELEKEMERHGVRNPWLLTEFDQWVNDAMRKDIGNIVEREGGEVFGLKLWTWEILPAEKLKEVCNFGVDLIFRVKDKEKVLKLIDEEAKKPFSMANTRKTVDKLFDLAILSCTWV
jgi:hypothetical protein